MHNSSIISLVLLLKKDIDDVIFGTDSSNVFVVSLYSSLPLYGLTAVIIKVIITSYFIDLHMIIMIIYYYNIIACYYYVYCYVIIIVILLVHLTCAVIYKT